MTFRALRPAGRRARRGLSSFWTRTVAHELLVHRLAVAILNSQAPHGLLASSVKPPLGFQLRSRFDVSRGSLAYGVSGGAKWGAEKTPVCSS